MRFADGSRLKMDGLYFPPHLKTDWIFNKRKIFFDELLKDESLALDSRPFEQIDAETNRYGDRHGRLLTANRLWVQKYLVREGLALWSGSAVYPPELAQEMQMAEREAEQHKKGLWARLQVHDASNPQMSAPKGRFIIAEGRVQEVYVTPKNTYLNFGEDWKSDFTAAIPSRSRPKFENRDWKLTALENKIVRIRGWIRFYNGPFLELSFPQQLEIMEMTGD
ncbi:MAG: thermonuclease family protein [Proteobacteria bacterium]|nr:thermonuclease family protein [Pseudomonadota bacterium]